MRSSSLRGDGTGPLAVKRCNFIRAVDPKAFVVIADVHEALGEGFKEIGADL